MEHSSAKVSWKGLPGTFPVALLHMKWGKSGVSKLSLLTDLPWYRSFICNAHKIHAQTKYFAFGRTVFSQIIVLENK